MAASMAGNGRAHRLLRAAAGPREARRRARVGRAVLRRRVRAVRGGFLAVCPVACHALAPPDFVMRCCVPLQLSSTRTCGRAVQSHSRSLVRIWCFCLPLRADVGCTVWLSLSGRAATGACSALDVDTVHTPHPTSTTHPQGQAYPLESR